MLVHSLKFFFCTVGVSERQLQQVLYNVLFSTRSVPTCAVSPQGRHPRMHTLYIFFVLWGCYSNILSWNSPFSKGYTDVLFFFFFAVQHLIHYHGSKDNFLNICLRYGKLDREVREAEFLIAVWMCPFFLLLCTLAASPQSTSHLFEHFMCLHSGGVCWTVYNRS